MASGGYNQSNASTSSSSGLRGTRFQGEQEGRFNESTKLAQRVAETSIRNPLTYNGQSAESINPSGRFGLGFNVDPAVEEASKQFYSLASANGAQRGRLTPEGANAAAGSALTQSLPQLIPQLMAFHQWQFQQPMNMNQFAVNTANSNVQSQAAGMGSQSQGESNSYGFNTGVANKPSIG